MSLTFSERKRVIITGGAGFIGSNLVDKLITCGQVILCLDDFNDFYSPQIKINNIKNHHQNISFKVKKLDIREKRAVDQAFDSFKPDVVVHLAARAGVRPSIKDPGLYTSVNINGTLNLLEASVKHKIKKFIYASSSSVYGINKKVPFAEDDAVLKPISPYASSKIAGEALCHTFAQLHNLPVVALRFFTVYGPRQRPDLAIHKFTRLILENKPLPLYGDGNSSRDYTYIDDIVEGICAAIDFPAKPYEVFNLGNSQSVTLKELVQLIEMLSGCKAIVNWQTAQPGDVPRTWADLSKSRRYLGYKPTTPLVQGIKKFMEWYKTSAQKGCE